MVHKYVTNLRVTYGQGEPHLGRPCAWHPTSVSSLQPFGLKLYPDMLPIWNHITTQSKPHPGCRFRWTSNISMLFNTFGLRSRLDMLLTSTSHIVEGKPHLGPPCAWYPTSVGSLISVAEVVHLYITNLELTYGTEQATPRLPLSATNKVYISLMSYATILDQYPYGDKAEQLDEGLRNSVCY